MNILLPHATHYKTGGDWTYLQTIKNLYSSRGHRCFDFSSISQNNEFSSESDYFIDFVDYKYLSKYNPFDVSKVLFNSIYNRKANKNISKLLLDYQIDVVQLNNIHNVQTLSIIPILKKYNLPIFWRVLDYKILCPNRTFINGDGENCLACLKSSSSILKKKCKKNSFLASLVAYIEHSFNYYMDYYSLIDGFFLQNEFSRDLFIAAGFSEEKLHVIKNPFDVSSHEIYPYHSGKRINFLYFGRLSSEKGIDTLLQTFANLSDLKLTIVGDGPLSDTVQHFSNTYNNISFIGPVWGNDLFQFISNCDYVVVPSEWYEPSPYVVLQAFDFGKPVIGSDIGGIPDLVKNDYNGFLFKSGDQLDLERVLLNASNSRFDFSFNCINYLKSNHSSKFYIDKTLEIFESFL